LNASRNYGDFEHAEKLTWFRVRPKLRRDSDALVSTDLETPNVNNIFDAE